MSEGHDAGKRRLTVVGPRDSRLVPVLVAGFEGVLGAGLREVLSRDHELGIVGCADETRVDGALEEHRPAVALVNHDALGGAVEMRRLAASYPATGIVVAVMRLSRERDAALLAAGARVVVPITVDASELRGVLRLVAQGLVGPPRLQRQGGGGVHLLTRREAEVVPMLVQRWSAREIADALHVTVATVNTHCRHIYEKLGVHSRRELARRAAELLGPDHATPPRVLSRERLPFRAARLTAYATRHLTSANILRT